MKHRDYSSYKTERESLKRKIKRLEKAIAELEANCLSPNCTDAVWKEVSNARLKLKRHVYGLLKHKWSVK